jgi:hypothetical protein
MAETTAEVRRQIAVLPSLGARMAPRTEPVGVPGSAL